VVSSANTINATLYDKLNFVFLRDIAAVAGIISLPFVMVVSPSVPAKTVPEFTAYAKANPGKISFGSPGIGTPEQLLTAAFGTKRTQRDVSPLVRFWGTADIDR
jgi:tripartite-type tricarboxylate transporter receptor subunit TctC